MYKIKLYNIKLTKSVEKPQTVTDSQSIIEEK